jgi:mono/diheme cytochrome c family protein
VEESGVQLASLDAAAAAPRMLVLRQTEASCASCHVGERYLPGAQRFDTALTRFERGGCYACHAAAAFDDVHKRGPDLRRIRGKLTPEWVRAWLRNPRAVKPNSMMPRFWGATADANAASSSVVVTQADEEEIAAVTAYLFSTGEPYSPAVSSPPRGDAARGAQVLRDVGCLGCHIVGDEPAPPGTRRSFGQPLQSLAGKVSYAWLYDWVRHPARFSPSTLMPDLRLTDRDAADVASYLTTLGGSALAPAGDVRRSDAVLRAQARRQTEGLPPSLVGTADLEALSGETLHVELGRRIVARLGCFNCHEIRGFEDAPRTATPLPAGRAWSADDLARLHAGVDPGDDRRGRRAPVYVIDGPLREQFALALTAVTRPAASGRIAASPAHEVRTAGRALVQRRNCVGCHTIEGTGGDFVQLVAEPSLGPPLLTPEGARVQAAWLRAFLGGPITIRPWLAVRMPTFGLGDAEVGAVSEYFRAIAVPNPAPQTAGAVPSPDAGRELFELLKCQQCHVLGSIPKDQPTSNLAPDLRMAHERLQPEWILAWLENPSAILPGTRMPSFWPDYPKSFYPPLDRDGARQIRAIRDHLLTLRGGPSPQR